MRTTLDIERECRERWDAGRYHERGIFYAWWELTLPWHPYETYMMAQHIRDTPGETGLLRVRFTGPEDNELHTHPGDRVVTVLEGRGWFVAQTSQGLTSELLIPGDRIWMPRGTLHTFQPAPAEGEAKEPAFTVDSVHHTYVPTDDPSCISYPLRGIEPCGCLVNLQNLQRKAT